MKDKQVAGILALFFGGLGVHKFYLGKVGLGFLYLLFFWTFIPTIVGWIEALIFFFMDEEKFDTQYNKNNKK